MTPLHVWLLFKVEFWYWLERRLPYFELFGKSCCARRKQAESDVVHVFALNIYGDPFQCFDCGDRKYHQKAGTQ